MSKTNCPEGAECGIHNRRDVDVYLEPETRETLLYAISYVNGYAVFTCDTVPDTAMDARQLLMWMVTAPAYETNIIHVGDLCLDEAVGGTFKGVRDSSKWREEYYDTKDIATRHHMVVDMLRADLIALD